MSGVRASDSEREKIASVLQAAAGEGRLSPEEAGERLALASKARFRDELNQLVSDLPSAAPVEPRWPARAVRFPWRAFRFAVAAALLIVLTGGRLFWMAWPLMFLAFGCFARARGYRHRWWGPSWRGAGGRAFWLSARYR